MYYMRKIVSIRLDEETLAAAQARAQAQNRTLTNYIETVLRQDMAGARDGFGESAAPFKTLPTSSQVIRMLRTHRAELEAMGVRHASIYGSVARGDNTAKSDVDILADMDQAVVKSLFDYAGIQQSLVEWTGGYDIDVKDRNRMSASILESALKDEIVAF
jgi:predicted nucleotidyltransferase